MDLAAAAALEQKALPWAASRARCLRWRPRACWAVAQGFLVNGQRQGEHVPLPHRCSLSNTKHTVLVPPESLPFAPQVTNQSPWMSCWGDKSGLTTRLETSQGQEPHRQSDSRCSVIRWSFLFSLRATWPRSPKPRSRHLTSPQSTGTFPPSTATVLGKPVVPMSSARLALGN